MTQGIEAQPVYTDWVILLTALILVLPLANAVGADMSDAELFKEMIPVWEKLNPPTKGQIEDPKKTTARKGPIALTLEVANTTVRKENGHYSLWIRVTLGNRSKKPIRIWTGAFRHLLALEGDSGLHFEIVGEDGQSIYRDRVPRPIESPKICPPPPGNPLWEKYKPPFVLPPGDSISTPDDWEHGIEEVTCLGRSPHSPLSPYGEVRRLYVGKNHKAKIRIVYDHEIRPSVIPTLKRPLEPEEIRLATEWISLSFIP